MIPHTDVGILTQAARHTLDRVKPSPCCRWWEPNWNPWVRLHPDNASAPSRTYSLYSRYHYRSCHTDDSLVGIGAQVLTEEAERSEARAKWSPSAASSDGGPLISPTCSGLTPASAALLPGVP